MKRHDMPMREAAELMDMLGNIFGIPPATLTHRERGTKRGKRDAMVTTARAVFGLVLADRGYSYPQIGRALFRDSSTMFSYISRATPVAHFISRGIREGQLTRSDAPSAVCGPARAILQHADGGMFHEGEAAA